MSPLETLDYGEIAKALDKIETGRRTYALGFEAVHLYMDIPFGKLKPVQAEVGQALVNIQETLRNPAKRRLYQVTPLPYLKDQLVPRSSREPVENSAPETEAS